MIIKVWKVLSSVTDLRRSRTMIPLAICIVRIQKSIFVCYCIRWYLVNNIEKSSILVTVLIETAKRSLGLTEFNGRDNKSRVKVISLTRATWFVIATVVAKVSFVLYDYRQFQVSRTEQLYDVSVHFRCSFFFTKFSLRSIFKLACSVQSRKSEFTTQH